MSRALRLLALATACVLLSACPTADDDDSTGSSDALLCESMDCPNQMNCLAYEPSSVIDCDFVGDCHYCEDGSSEAAVWTCDGSTFSYMSNTTCNPS
jgi:hypothetical protein